MKRLLDVTLSAIGLALSSPLWLLVAAAIKLDDRGPVFHRQTRIGRGGRPFVVLKFRSMRVTGTSADTLTQARESDPRITRVGRVLRKTAADELPQLLSIFVGDMSFVGPRALMPEEIETGSNGRAIPMHEIPGYETRITVTPGLTGLAQIMPLRHPAPQQVPLRQTVCQPPGVLARCPPDRAVVLDQRPRYLGNAGPKILKVKPCNLDGCSFANRNWR